MRRHILSRQRGYILLPVVLLISLVAAAAFMLNNESVLETGVAVSSNELARADYVAEAGLQHALWQVEQAGCGPYTDISGEAFGNHSYSASITPNGIGGIVSTYTVSVTDDAMIKKNTPTQNYGSDAQLATFADFFLIDVRRALYRFDIASAGIPASSTVVSAVARVFVVDSNDAASVSVHQITADWIEATVNWDNINADHDASLAGTIPAASPVGQYVEVNITALVQSWVNGSTANQGIMLKTQTNFSDLAEFTSKEYGTASQRPELVIKIVDGSLSNRAIISATGTLASGVSSSMTRADTPLYQPPTSVTVQPDAASGKDTEIWDQAPNTNYGNAVETWVSSASNDNTHSLLQFSMGEIPAGVRILEAALSLYRQSGSGADQPVSAHRIMNSWSENAVTWNSRETGTNWDTAGGDFDNMAVATTLVGPANQRYEWNIAPLVQGWVDGSYPNYGVVLTAAVAGMLGERFYTSDAANPSRHPHLTITYACECGITCQIPQGSGNVLLVVGDDVTLDPVDIKKKSLFEAWGYTVNLLDDDALQTSFDNQIDNNDVAYISDTVSDLTLGDKLANTSKGVLNEDAGQNANLGLSSGGSHVVSQSMEVIDNSHYITALFPLGVLPINRAPMEGLIVSGTPAPGLQTLGNLSSFSSLAFVDAGGLLGGDKNGENAAGRRVAIPIGSSDKFNWDYLNNNGRLIVQRAIQWGSGNTSGAPAGTVLLVVGNAASPASKDTGRIALMESWGYTVTVIDDSESQSNIDAAAAAVDVAYVSGTISGGALADKLTGSATPIVNEFFGKLDNYGFSNIRTATASADTLTNSSATHYISEPFAGADINVFSSVLSMPVPSGTLAPDLDSVAQAGGYHALATLDTGATRWDGNPAPARRAFLPYANAETSQLTTDGETIMKRALEWVAGAATPAPSYNVLLIVGNLTLSSKDIGYKALIESWGHTVSLIDDGDSQANYDTAMDAADVILASGSSLGAYMLDKATYTTTGMVNEVPGKIDNFGFSSSKSSTANFDTFSVTSPTHYITEPFSGNPVTVFNTSLTNPIPGGTLAPDLSNVAEVSGTLALGTLDIGAMRYDSTPSQGRRVHLPYQTAETTDMTNDGKTILQRSLEWAAGEGSGSGGGGEPPPTTGVVFEEFTDAKRTNNGKSLSISKPGGVVAGDLLITAIATDGKQGDDGIQPLSGWNLIYHGMESEQVTLGAWWKIASASEAGSYTFTWPEKQKAYGFIMRFTGHDPSNPINVSANTGGSSSSPTSPAVTTTVADAMILRIGGFDDDDVTAGDPGLPGHTVITMDQSSNGSGTASAGAGYLMQSAAGGSGTSNFSLNSSEQYRAVTVGIAPAP